MSGYVPSERTGLTRPTVPTEDEAANPRAPPSSKRGRTKQSKALNLLDRLRTYADDVWRLTTDHGVPFSNNIAEQAVRMPKVKQKISGSFRTQQDVQTVIIGAAVHTALLLAV